jgi:hypothetical protein
MFFLNGIIDVAALVLLQSYLKRLLYEDPTPRYLIVNGVSQRSI